MTVFSTGDASRYRGAIWSNNSLLDRKLMYDLTFLPSACIQLWVTLLVRQAPVKSKIYRESIRSPISIDREQLQRFTGEAMNQAFTSGRESNSRHLCDLWWRRRNM